LKPYFIKTPKFVQRIFPKRVWAFPNLILPAHKATKSIYLTFDDGPIPEVTFWVLDQLKKYDAKATFFCIGDNIRKHPTVFRRIIAEGHAIGNHTYNHLNGWKTNTKDYIENVRKAEALIEEELQVESRQSETQDRKLLFRPPYGKLTTKQSQMLQKKGCKIIMWDLLSGDFDNSISQEKCFRNISENIQSRNIVVFHDSLKAEKNLRYALPKTLELIFERGWECKKI